ncbi:protein kinase [Actinoplanes sp. NBRC 101535]|uniref:protein kinase domain-containing protein n=1 Tax=Actinoplanes sp. NBRC 101535 TaxID=3032196 RepID=UPI002554A13B|nr:protein kinase [Actinoplanes sp. NBRC 101535]
MRPILQHSTTGLPANILLDEARENAVLADLGSAGRIEPDTDTAPNYGGTPLYLAPEAMTVGRVTRRSDLYSIGVATVEMLAGRFPYEEFLFDDVDERNAAGKRALIDSFYSLPPSVPPAVRKFIGSLIQINPAKRPATARAALRKLNSLDYVDWRRTAGTGLIGEWVGTWPPRKMPERRRQYRIRSSPVERGDNAGRIGLIADSKKPGREWRSHRGLQRYAEPRTRPGNLPPYCAASSCTTTPSPTGWRPPGSGSRQPGRSATGGARPKPSKVSARRTSRHAN